VSAESQPVEAQTLADRLGTSLEAVEAVRSSEMLDLHIDTFIPMRLWGYDIEKRHDTGRLRGRFAGHLDLPRMEDAHLTGAMWSVTTNPFRTKRGRWKTAVKNFKKLREVLKGTEGRTQIVTTHSQFTEARAAGAHAVLLSIQGGNAMDDAPDDGEFLPDPDVLRVTLVHLTNSLVGQSSNPMQVYKETGITDLGRQLVERLNDYKVFVDLAHISKQGFWESVEVHDKSQPLLVTHTGVEGITPHWRNIDDDQIRQIADTGGTVGIMFHTPFLVQEGRDSDCTLVIDHVEHVIDVVGDDFVSIGSDYDGAITPPVGLRSGDSYPVLVQEMLNRGWSATRIEKILAGNFLRAFRALRP
jgi:membrane dipeptidase